MNEIYLNNELLDVVKYTPTNKSYKISLGRKGQIDKIDKILKTYQFNEYGICVFCNRKYKRNFEIIFKQNENKYDIIDVVLSKYNMLQSKGLEHIELKACRKKCCSGHGLNTNSVEYVNKTLNMNKDEALKHIHKRNKTPFYSKIMIHMIQYKKYQSINRFNDDKKREIIKKQTYSKSKEGYINKYGNEIGLMKWKNYNKLKAITLNNMIRIHGKDKGNYIYNNWKKKIKPSLENRINKHGKENGLRIWNEELERTSHYGYKFRTENKNLFLRSRHEYNFYLTLKKFGFDDYDLEVDKPYNLSKDGRRSDFYIKIFDCHIEIAGMMKNETYAKKLNDKIKDYSPYVIYPHDDFIDKLYEIIVNEERKIDVYSV